MPRKSQPVYRPAVARDLAALLGLVKSYYRSDGIAFGAKNVRAGLKQLLSDPSLGCAWFITLDGQTIGYAVVTFGFDHEFGGRVATLTDLYLEPEHRGRGYGRKSLEHVERFLVSSGVPAIELQAERHNRRAVRLYRSFGFQSLDRMAMVKRIKP